MFKQEITVDMDILDAIEDGARKMPVLMDTAFKRNVSRLASRVLAELKQTPGPVKYPIRWTSERQRRAFFATKGFGRGIPTRRTGKLQEGWKVIFRDVPEGSIFVIGNTVPYMTYVEGIQQQGFHKNTGWIQSQDVLADALVEAEDVLIETWFTVTDGVIT